MLKITTVETADTCSLVVEGMLIEPWVMELDQSWVRARQDLAAGRQLVVDLAGVTVIGCRGEELLFRMMADGTQFVCKGVLTRFLLRRMERKCKGLDGSGCGKGVES